MPRLGRGGACISLTFVNAATPVDLADFHLQERSDRLRALDRDGAVAQLGERRNGIAKVRGSIPLGSTNLQSGLTSRHFSENFLRARSPAYRPAAPGMGGS